MDDTVSSLEMWDNSSVCFVLRDNYMGGGGGGGEGDGGILVAVLHSVPILHSASAVGTPFCSKSLG